MLAGIGGPTIAQAKAAITLREAGVWMAYRKRRGSLNHSLRLEEGFAYVLSAIHSIGSKNPVPPTKFMPHVMPPEAEQEAATDISAVFGLLNKVATTNKTQS